MARTVHRLVAQLRRLAGGPGHAAQTDRRLLEAFAKHNDEAAFAALVERHGPLVMGVCRRILGNDADAEDAFQATFLILARKAGGVAWQASVKNWLYGVACRVARKARTQAARRRKREQIASETPPAEKSAAWDELRAILDEELEKLPARYRAPLLLCYLDGKTRDEAAEELGWSAGSVKGRLERGRELLRLRLEKRGLTLPAALCAALLSGSAASAMVPATLTTTTVTAALSFAAGALVPAGSVATQLAQGVLNAMLIAKLKWTGACVLTLAVAALGLGWGLHEAEAQRPGGADRAAPAPAVARPAVQEPIFFQERGGGGRVEGAQVQGIVKSVDAGSIAITTGNPREGGQTDKSYPLIKGVEVVVGGGAGGRGGLFKEAKLTELTAGLHVALVFTGDQKLVEAIIAEAPAVRGVLKAVDADKKTVTISQSAVGAAARGGEPPAPLETTYAVAADAEIAVDDGRGGRFSTREAKLAELANGAIVSGRLSLDRKKVQFLIASGGTYIGTIKALDAGKKTLTLTLGSGGRGEAPDETVLAVAPDAIVLIDDGKGRRLSLRQGKLADLPVGAMAQARLSADQSGVTFLKVEGPTLAGVLKAVDPDKGVIVLGIPKGRDGFEEKTLTVAKDARIVTEGGDGKLSSLKVGDAGPMIQVWLSLDQKTVQAVTAVQGRR